MNNVKHPDSVAPVWDAQRLSARGTAAAQWFRSLQRTLCATLEGEEPALRFISDPWKRLEGGGGVTAVLQEGEVFEKAGIGFSEVFGRLSDHVAQSLAVPVQLFAATGISLIVHPRNPLVPTVHLNCRFFEMEDGTSWFGGGSDLTPSYIDEEGFAHFHDILKSVCERYERGSYEKFKEWADRYFYLPHRQEHRGIGGIFFDKLRDEPDKTFRFVQDLGNAFVESYLPIVIRRKGDSWGERERKWQLLRRGRYAEFNLLHDRGTDFGLQSGGRVESVLMSLPPEVRWEYGAQPERGSREEAMVRLLKTPKSWASR